MRARIHTVSYRELGVPLLAAQASLFCAACTSTEHSETHYSRPSSVMVEASFVPSVCPKIETYSVSPLRTSVGGKVAVRVVASPAEGGATSYSWSASQGEVDDPTAAETTYICAAPGVQTLTITVADGAGCGQKRQLTVTCI